MAKNLEKLIGRDVRQAENYAQKKDGEVSGLQKELQNIDKEEERALQQFSERRKAAHAALVATTQEAREAWEYVRLLEKA